MFHHIHTIEWNYYPEKSDDKIMYFVNKVDGRILAQNKVKKGYEYYLCSEVQMNMKLLGEYIGCARLNSDGSYPKLIVTDHEHQPEKTVSINDEEYL